MLINILLVGSHALSSTRAISLRVSVLVELLFIFTYCLFRVLPSSRLTLKATITAALEGWFLFGLLSIVLATLVNSYMASFQ